MATLKELLAQARPRLAAAGVAAPALDARLLLQHAAGLSAAALIADQGVSVDGRVAERFRLLIERRVRREPVSKIVGVKEFYGREFEVSRDVLDPRPDSESLVELCLEISDANGCAQILDLGTGSGILLLTLLAERRQLEGLGTDLSHEALEIAARNAAAHGLTGRCALVQGDWFVPVAERFHLIVSNPPYIEAAAIDGLQPEVNRHDPRLALDGGPDGLESYRRIAAQAGSYLAAGGHVAVEIGLGQAAAVIGIFGQNGFEPVGKRSDLSGRPRALAFRAV